MRCLIPGVRLRNTGFTLLELLVVLVLAAITASVVGGGAQSFMERARYHQAVRDVATQLNQARALCIQEGRAVVVAYEPQNRQLSVDGKPSMAIPASLEVEWSPAERPTKDAPAVGEALFVFNPDGGARGGRLAVLRGGLGVVFRVNWLFGTIEQAAIAASA